MSLPFDVPLALVAVARKWYVVAHDNPVRVPPPMNMCDVPKPMDCSGVTLPYAFVRPHWYWAVVARPFGLTSPFSVAPNAVMLEASNVLTAGAHVKIWSPPRPAP